VIIGLPQVCHKQVWLGNGGRALHAQARLQVARQQARAEEVASLAVSGQVWAQSARAQARTPHDACRQGRAICSAASVWRWAHRDAQCPCCLVPPHDGLVHVGGVLNDPAMAGHTEAGSRV